EQVAGQPLSHLAAGGIRDTQEQDIHRRASWGCSGGVLSFAASAVSGKCRFVRLEKATSDSITGTSTSTPTTVTSPTPECRPNRPMATATASSKKFEVPIRAQGAAILCGTRHAQAAA